MAKSCEIRFTLPGELINWAKLEDLTAKAKESFVMFLLREGTVTQGYAARALGLTRWELMQAMDRYGVPVIDLTEEELRAEVELTERTLRGEEA
jgi:predicted HTH domain antitoxin